MPDDVTFQSRCECGHPRKSHRYGGANAHGKYTFLSSCRKQDCDCGEWRPGGGGDG